MTACVVLNNSREKESDPVYRGDPTPIVADLFKAKSWLEFRYWIFMDHFDLIIIIPTIL